MFYFCCFNISLQIYDSTDFEPILKKKILHSRQMYTVTQGGYELKKAAHGFGWQGVGGGPACVGWPRIKSFLFFLELF
jgi:hypothetical protein